MKKAPGKAHRKGLTLLQVADKFRDDEAALKWLEEQVWPDGPFCPNCGSFNVQSGIKHKTMTHRLPGLSKAAYVLHPQGNGHGKHQAPLSRLGRRHLSLPPPTSRAFLP